MGYAGKSGGCGSLDAGGLDFRGGGIVGFPFGYHGEGGGFGLYHCFDFCQLYDFVFQLLCCLRLFQGFLFHGGQGADMDALLVIFNLDMVTDVVSEGFEPFALNGYLGRPDVAHGPGIDGMEVPAGAGGIQDFDYF